MSVMRVFSDGTKKWFDERGRPHRGGGLPAVVFPDGFVEYYLHGELLGVEHADGCVEWYAGAGWLRVAG